MPSVKLASFSAFFALVSALILTAINSHVPDAYMDEIFHVPQTQRYCAGNWKEWDAKITTFPGLYIVGALFGRLVAAVAPPTLCSTQTLRTLNVLLSLLTLPIFYNLAAALDRKRSQNQLILMTAVCALLPLHFFYTFLYYTDVASTLFTLSCWLLAEQSNGGGRHLSALFGAFAVLTRQTNVVWVAFIAARIALEMCSVLLPPNAAQKQGKKQNRKRKVTPKNQTTIVLLVQRAWQLRVSLLRALWPFAVVVGAFAVFVVRNGGVVVGDKEHHIPVRHLMQPLYCLVYCTVLLNPVYWLPTRIYTNIASIFRSKRSKGWASPLSLVGAAMVGGGVVAAVATGTLTHPFLLADNRHYTFYVWRRIVNRAPWSRYALVPVYVYSGVAVSEGLAGGGRQQIERVLLAVIAAAVLIPAHLIEFRYYTIVFYAVFLLSRTPSSTQMAVTAVIFAACNAATLYMFAARPFEWGDGSVARFMW